ncbi:MAG TPA: NAD(P)-dependent oxidoreductase [Lacunisphaera sp.]|jgi:3-hydroxyisobutyrate dehydrogenase|nr:NAD(P)-dependent oxidoreductase [Lacunisphaera sp.]
MTPIGFLGLGTMGEVMALRLLRAGHALHVWNRTAAKAAPLAAAGARVAASPADVIAACPVVFLMLADGAATDAVLGRGTPAFAAVRGRLFVNCATVAPDYSRGLEQALRAAGARFVEAPVSGSRKPAETGTLIAMLAGEPDAVAEVAPLFAPLAKQAIACGPVPNGTLTKLATNILLVNSVAALAEMMRFADAHGLDRDKVAEVVSNGQLGSDNVRIRAAKLAARDFTAHSAIRNVLDSLGRTGVAATAVNCALPLTERTLQLLRDTVQLGHADADMIALYHAIERSGPGEK